MHLQPLLYMKPWETATITQPIFVQSHYSFRHLGPWAPANPKPPAPALQSPGSCQCAVMMCRSQQTNVSWGLAAFFWKCLFGSARCVNLGASDFLKFGSRIPAVQTQRFCSVVCRCRSGHAVIPSTTKRLSLLNHTKQNWIHDTGLRIECLAWGSCTLRSRRALQWLTRHFPCMPRWSAWMTTTRTIVLAARSACPCHHDHTGYTCCPFCCSYLLLNSAHVMNLCKFTVSYTHIVSVMTIGGSLFLSSI